MNLNVSLNCNSTHSSGIQPQKGQIVKSFPIQHGSLNLFGVYLLKSLAISAYVTNKKSQNDLRQSPQTLYLSVSIFQMRRFAIRINKESEFQ